jgi:hypothetical protein
VASTELGVGILLLCVSLIVAAAWGGRADPDRSAAPRAQTSGPALVAPPQCVAETSVAP